VSDVVVVCSGLSSTVLSLFAGFLIKYESFPSFWTFLYWLNPLHYALEGIFVTMFYDDDTLISMGDGSRLPLNDFVSNYFPSWSFSHRWWDVMALVIVIMALK
jgi:hypothetical protein